MLLLVDTAGCDMEEVAEEGGDSTSNPGEAQVRCSGDQPAEVWTMQEQWLILHAEWHVVLAPADSSGRSRRLLATCRRSWRMPRRWSLLGSVQQTLASLHHIMLRFGSVMRICAQCEEANGYLESLRATWPADSGPAASYGR